MLHQRAHLLIREAAGADGAFGLAADGFDHVLGGVLHVAQDLTDAVAFDHVADFVAVVGEADVDGVGVAEFMPTLASLRSAVPP